MTQEDIERLTVRAAEIDLQWERYDEDNEAWVSALGVVVARADLHALLSEREALQSRVNELEAARNAAEAERDNLGESLQRETKYRVLAEQQAEDAEARAEALQSTVSALREGLEPFARDAAQWDGEPGLVRYDNTLELWQSGRTKVCVGDLRRARSLLPQGEGAES